MIAFVFSGGGSRGAMEAGGVKALYEAGIRPDMLVGSSAGAMNAAFLAIDPSTGAAERLCDIWRSVSNQTVVPGGLLSKAWRLITRKPSIFAQEPLRAFIENQIPPDVQVFGDLPSDIELYITAANLQTSALYLFGEDDQAGLRDAVLASSAFPGGFPPVQHGRWQYTDGGVIANVPISVAIEKGAKTIYAMDVAYTGGIYGPAKDVVSVLLRVASIMLYHDLQAELDYAAQHPGVTLHHIIIRGVGQASDFDFDHGAEMVEVGYEQVKRYLAGLDPSAVDFREPADFPAPAPPPPGARLWVPPQRREGP
ncbi:MAG TPA: patatin-like phospholipase family protein [Anaerolineae bacterium]|nr:patatin-like phospholipase family protein [Anaerolineae bacterium]